MPVLTMTLGAPCSWRSAKLTSLGHRGFHSEALHVVERWTFLDPNTIEYKARLEVPTRGTRVLAWAQVPTLRFQLRPALAGLVKLRTSVIQFALYRAFAASAGG